MLLNRDDWYDTSRDLQWDCTYVDQKVAFPEQWTGAANIPEEAWRKWDEPFRVSYRDYVRIQREKESGVKAVSGALVRAGIYEKLDPAHVAASHFHMGAITGVEHMAVTLQSRFCRFAPAPAWRNLGVFGMLDETRHTQLNLRFAHDLIKADPRFDWAQKAFHTNEWGVLAVKNFFDDIMLNADCVEASLAASLTVEHGFTNLQFVALAADAMAAGDINWSNLLSSTQTDEARHAQTGFPTLGILMEHDPERAQRALDVAFWRSTRLFQTLTGTAMDYYTPLELRKMSFKEFMLEWVVNHHERVLRDYGLKKPWYWDQFLRALETGHHAMHIGTWFWRPTLFWKPNAGVSKDERAWLNEKYPTWEADFGFMWDEIIANINAGRMEKTLPETLPSLCNLTQLPLGAGMGPHELAEHSLMYNGRLYQFDSEISKWCFEQDPERYAGHRNIIDRFIAGEIQPPDLSGGLAYMSLTPEVMGDDVYGYEWAKDYLPSSNGSPKHAMAGSVSL
ncbi:isoprene monooxygenase oxygenase subunit alpha [Mycobacterium paragordonae]|uniref:isoprene monooxygenase oxygenase subunit alpha n=1 Tax=Mycobacterium paragordonae TaxID=1389713 RepID=UPI0012E16EBF|nr:isoprene monooxygenase oxygenase subunit alpha [Mycobacterium paragordonae]